MPEPTSPSASLAQALAQLKAWAEKADPSERPQLLSALGELESRFWSDDARDQQLEAEQAARAEAEAAQRRLGFLYNAMNRIFAGPMERGTRLGELARLTVPDLADWCVVDELGQDHQLHRLGLAHWDPAQVQRAQLTSARYSVAQDPRDLLARAVMTGESVLVTDAQTLAGDVSLLQGLPSARVPPTSLAVLPLMSSGRAVGLIRLVFAESGRRYLPEDLPLLEDLRRLAAVALDNARLYENTRRAARAREDLLAVVSHDLQNPLHVILMSAEVLLHSLKQEEGKARDKATVIHRSAERMVGLIRLLLDAASIEAGRLSVAPEPQELRALLTEAHQLHVPLAEQKKQELVLELPAHPTVVVLDRQRILQVLSNLIGNAVKFTPEGGRITLAAVLEKDDVELSVMDSGPGIPSEQLPHVFDRYWQARETASKGTGLGLFISHGIVQAHGGKIWAQSVVGQGTTFRVKLPRRGTPALGLPAAL